VAFVMVLLWRWHPLVVALVAGAFLLVDIAFFAANVIKIPEGGWFPIVMGLISFTVLTTWRRGRKLVRRELAKQGIPMSAFLPAIGSDIHRVSGTAVFMTSSKEGVPAALLHNLKHNQILHERVALVTVETTDTPYVNDFDRLYLHPMEKGFMRIVIRYGFMEDPDIPLALEQCKRFGEPFEMMETTFYVSRETVIPGVLGRRINPWRARLFAFMSKNATSATDFFKIPNNRVVELGTQLVI
jgi:KUP system potassium uptake protein